MKQKKLTVYYYTDPQHGWYRVKELWFKKYGIDASKISNCSYQGVNGIVFLEEDVDGKLLLDALERNGITPKIVNLHTNKSSKIRLHPHYVYNENAVATKSTKRATPNVKVVEHNSNTKKSETENTVADEEILASGFAYTDEAPIFNEAENV